MDSDRPIADLEAQLRSLYTERAILFAELGTADARAVVAIIRSLEAQLADLYGERVAFGVEAIGDADQQCRSLGGGGLAPAGGGRCALGERVFDRGVVMRVEDAHDDARGGVRMGNAHGRKMHGAAG